MGGRGGKSKLSKSVTSAGKISMAGFSVKMNGKNVEVYQNESGVVLFNGKYMKNADYEKMYQNMKNDPSFKELTADYIESKIHERYKNYNSGDAELLLGIGTKGRIAKKIRKYKK